MCSDDPFLGAAASIGRRIVGDAVWDDGCCSWMGAVVDPARPWRVEYRARGPSLYDGTAGIGLFLSQLATVTDEADVRRTAVGALRHAIRRAQVLPPDQSDGFHAGSLGVAWAVMHAAALLGEEELLVGARALARPPSGPGRCPDVILGRAGALAGLLALAEALDQPQLVDEAIATGEELIACATITPHGWCWQASGQPRPLCGLSHGAAGIGSALLELFAATGDERFRTAATSAFAWERSWLDARSCTWPDLRIGGPRRGTPPPAGATWCHGEAGIALTRLRAVAVLGSPADRRDAELALETTRRQVVAALPYEIHDLTLCHGAAGAADVLLAGAALGGRWREAAGVARQLGYAALERHDMPDDGWPCEGLIGTTPELFRGLSGIAWWFLRLRDETMLSPLAMPVRPLTGMLAQA